MTTLWQISTMSRIAASFCVLALAGCDDSGQTRLGTVQDEANSAELTGVGFGAGESYFRDMDGGIARSPAEIVSTSYTIGEKASDNIRADAQARAKR
jgi:hypothetical protein